MTWEGPKWKHREWESRGRCVSLEWEPEGPHAFVQWKGTDACFDVRCTCGASPHIDGDFLHALRCANCGQRYEVIPYVVLRPIEEECEWHEPKVMEPDCDSCTIHPCGHTMAWEIEGKPVPVGYPWPKGDSER